jgi:hypothetical protein
MDHFYAGNLYVEVLVGSRKVASSASWGLRGGGNGEVSHSAVFWGEKLKRIAAIASFSSDYRRALPKNSIIKITIAKITPMTKIHCRLVCESDLASEE